MAFVPIVHPVNNLITLQNTVFSEIPSAVVHR